MKKIKIFKSGFGEKLKLLLIPIGLLIGSLTTQVWAWYYITGDANLTGYEWHWYEESCKMTGTPNSVTFMAKAESTYYFKLYKRVSDSDKWDQPCGSIHSATGTGLVSSGKQSGDCGAMWVQTSGVCNITFKVYGSNQVDIEVTQCAYYIKYPWWGENGWKWSGALADCYDGTNYFTMGNYNGNNSGFCYGRKNSDGGADCNTEGGSDYGTTTTHTTKGSPSSGTQCYFIYNPSNHTLDIRKPHTVTQPNYIYFDNSDAQWSNSKIYFIIGHSKATPWQNVHLTAEVANTKLRYALNESSWTDAGYYAMIGTGSGGWNGGSGVSYTSLNDAEVRSAVNWDYYEMSANHHYIVGMTSGASGTPITFTDKGTTTSSLNNTQTIKYSISRDGGGSYSEQNSGVTPAQLSLSSYQFANGTYGSVSSTSQTISVNQSSTYSKSVSAAYTATTTFSYTSKRDGYTFIGWYTTASGSTEISSPYYPKGENTIYARFKAHRYTIAFNKNDAQYPGTTSSGSMTSISNVVYDQNVTLTENDYKREGYTFAGWSTTPTGGVAYSDGQSVSNLSATDGATVTLYAQWTEILHDITVEYKCGETSVQVDGKVEDVGIVTTKDATAPATIGGYSFTEWSTLPSAVKTSDELTENTITINATDDGQTITANYEPTTYNGTLEGVDGSDGTYSVVYGETTLTVTGEAPARAGYHPQGYYLYYDGTLKNYSNPIAYASETTSKELVKSAPGGLKTHTDADGKWIYTGDAPTIYIQWEANTHTLTLYKNDGTGDNIPTSVTYGSNVCTPTITIPTRAGYAFAGYWTAASGGAEIIRSDLSKIESSYFDASTSNWKYDGDVDLYAHWDPVALTFNGTTDGDWGTASNWSPACVPTIEHDVTINDEVTVSDAAAAKNIAFGEDGKLNIESTGALEVAGTITNTDASKINVAARGALIFDNSAGTTQATVELSLNSSRWQMIAIPVGYVNVSDAFVGSSVYTYVWKYGEGWERRGYYDGLAAFESVLIKGSAGKTFTGALVSTADKSFTASYDDSKVSGDVTMYGNSWPAPIAISRMDLTATADGAVHVFTGSGWEGGTISDYIPALQGYAVIAKSTGGTVKIPYSAVRAVPAANRNTALRAPKRTTSDIFDHITIYVSGNEWQTRIRLYENEQFSDEIDKGYEALYMEGEGIAGELYAQAAEKMNVLAVPDLEGTVVGFVPGQATSYTLSFEGDGRGYYLNDVETKKSTLIAEGNTYTFSRSDNDASRFIISRTPIQNLPTGVGNINDGAQARKVLIDNKIYIIRGGRMYDATGALVK